MIMKRFILMGLLCAFVSVSFAQQRKTQVKRTVSTTATNNNIVVEQLTDSIIVLNDKIKELNDRVKDLQKRLNVEAISELTGKDGTIYRVINCEYDYNEKVLTIEFQIVNHIDDQDIHIVGRSSFNKIVAVIDDNSYSEPSFYLGKLVNMNHFFLDKNVTKNFSLIFYSVKKLPKTLNSIKLYEVNSGTELHFKEIPIKRNV